MSYVLTCLTRINPAFTSNVCRSFTDIAFIDFQDNSKDWLSNGIIDAQVYTERLGHLPQSLNDFKMSCSRLAENGQLPMPFADCEARRQKFGNTLRIMR